MPDFYKRRKKIIIFLFLGLLVISSVFLSTKRQESLSFKTDSSTTDISMQEPTPEGVFEEDEEDLSDAVLGSEFEVAQPGRESARVIGVRDGDTIEVEFGGGMKKTVRYIGIDTPESVDPRRPVECFGKEASNMNVSLVMNKTVQLEKDVSETDKYGRLLRYVYADGIFVNKYLVEEGFAHASAYPPDVKYQEDLDAAEVDAREAGRGLWGSCDDTPNASGQSGAIASGDKDCSDFATHQDAQDYFVSRGGSSTNNVDKLDGADHDGIACETLP